MVSTEPSVGTLMLIFRARIKDFNWCFLDASKLSLGHVCVDSV